MGREQRGVGLPGWFSDDYAGRRKGRVLILLLVAWVRRRRLSLRVGGERSGRARVLSKRPPAPLSQQGTFPPGAAASRAAVDVSEGAECLAWLGWGTW